MSTATAVSSSTATVEATTATVEATTAAMESSATTMEATATAAETSATAGASEATRTEAASAKMRSVSRKTRRRAMWRTIARSKVIAVAAEIPEAGRAERVPGRIVAPAKWTVENPVARDVRIGVKTRVPIPAGVSPDTGRPTASAGVSLSRIGVGVGEVGGTQAGPAIEVILIRFPIEFPRLKPSLGIEIELVFPLRFNLVAVCLNYGFSVEHADLTVVRVNVV